MKKVKKSKPEWHQVGEYELIIKILTLFLRKIIILYLVLIKILKSSQAKNFIAFLMGIQVIIKFKSMSMIKRK